MQHLAAEIGTHDHIVFGGMTAADAGFMRRKMGGKIPPQLRDRRDWVAIKA